MIEYKVANLITNEVRLVEWKIRENSKLSKGSVIFIYEYNSPVDGNTKTEKYKSRLNGITVNKICDIKAGDIIKKGDVLFFYEKCSHPIECNDMCGVCGEDLRKNNEILKKAPKKKPEQSHKLPIVPSEPKLKVNKKEADELGKQDLNNLVKNKKLVLLVDLDHTLIHTTNEYMGDKLKDVYHYELCQKNVWYYTKFRPGCKRFLEEMSKLYELQIVTFGERKYAHTIANFMDHDRRFFHDRILSRNEIFNPISKTDNLKALFPRGDLMVCIIDDREDVWNYARNLICVQPYIYFKNTGDINDPTNKNNQNNSKRKMIENSNSNKQIQIDSSSTSSSTKPSLSEKNNEIKNESNENVSDESNTSESTSSENSKDQILNSDKIQESETISKSSELNEEVDNDPDNYLHYLEDILRKIHDEYYKIYEARIRSHNNNNNNEKSTDSFEVNESDLPDLKKVLPLIKSRVLSNVVITFSGVVPTGYDLKKQRCYLMTTSLGAKVNEELVLSNGDDDDNDEEDTIQNQATNKSKYEYNFDDEESSSSSGGDTRSDDSVIVKNSSGLDSKKRRRYTTHLVAAKYGTSKVHDALKSKRPIKVVTPEWLINCAYKWIHCDEDEYKLTKEYDYKNCIFHEEYQKYSSTSAASNINIAKKHDLIIDEKKQSTLSSKRNISETKETFNFNVETATSSNSSKKVTFSIESTDVENKTKKQKSNAYESDQNKPSDESNDSLIMGLNDDLFETMDKEVDEELQEIDDDLDEKSDMDDENEEDDSEEYSNIKRKKSNEDSSEDSNQTDESDSGNKTSKKDNKSNNLSSSSSYDSKENSVDSIEDELALALERDFSEKQ